MLITNSTERPIIDGCHIRGYILKNEIKMVSKPDNLYGARKMVGQKEFNQFKSVVDRQIEPSDLIRKLAYTQKKFDVLAGLSYTSELYNYLINSELTAMSCGMSENEFEKTVKSAKNLINLYRTFNQFPAQLVAKVDRKNTINVDSSYTDSEGKQSNIVSNIATELEDKAAISDNTLLSNYKIYLQFLYSASCAIKGVKNMEAILSNIIPLLMLLWTEDSYRAYMESTKGVNGKDYTRETNNILLFPIIEKINDSKSICTINKVDNKLETDTSLAYTNIQMFLQSSCNRVYTQYSARLTADDKIDTDPFVFARYIWRLFKLVGIDLTKDSKLMTRRDIQDVMLNPLNPTALVNLIPAYKFSPDVFLKTKSFEEWFEMKDIESSEYGLDMYPLESKISQPVISILSTSGTGMLPAALQSKSGAILNQKQEVQHLLQLTHLQKLFNSNNYLSDILRAKRKRVTLFEPPLTMSGSKKVGERNITDRVNHLIASSPNPALLYEIRGIKIPLYNGLFSIINKGEELNDTSIEIRNAIDQLIDNYIKDIANLYLDYYLSMDWNFPFVTKKSTLIDLIKNTKHVDVGTNYYFLLGDCLTLQLGTYDSLHNVMDVPKLYALTKSYKLVRDNKMYTPSIFYIDKVITEAEFNICGYTKYHNYDEKTRCYTIKVPMLGVES